MSPPEVPAFEELAAQVAELKARQAILHAVAAYARGVDRHDEEIVQTAFHPDALDQHGPSLHPASEIGAEVNSRHAAWLRAHTHNLTTHTCEIDGDEAHAETYVLAGLAAADGTHVRLCGARYIDRLQRRDGSWRIFRRKVIIDWMMTGDASFFGNPTDRAYRFPAGTWDRRDPSYARPLTLEET
jgi:hypothetical protein